MRLIKLVFLISLFFGFTNLNAQDAPKPAPATRQVVSGLVLLDEKQAPDFQAIVTALGTDWKIQPDSLSNKDGTLVFMHKDFLIMLAWLDYPVNPSEIGAAAGISWLWKTAETDAARHKSHLVVSVVGSAGQSLVLYKLFTKVAASTLDKTASAGIYMSSQYLLLQKDYYLQAAKNMSDLELPIYLWVYFGLYQENKLNSGYTYGLKEFGLSEMEIFNSSLSIHQVHAFLFDVTHDVVLGNRKIKEGEKVGTANQENTPAVAHIGSSNFLKDGTSIRLDF